MPSQPSGFRFGEFEVSPEAAELRRGGEVVHLEPKVLHVLVYLLEHRERVVEKGELLDAVWEGAFVTENALTKAIARLRQALDDPSHDSRYIQTVHKLGYRFIAEVEIAVSESEPEPRPEGTTESPPDPPPEPPPELLMDRTSARGRVLAVLLVVLLAVAGLVVLRRYQDGYVPDTASSQQVRSLAVLPLANLTGDPDQEYFVDAIHDALIGELAQLEPLRVISRQSTLQYRDVDKPMPEIARELAVDALVEGSVMRTSDRVRVSTQIVLGSTDAHLWSESFERQSGDVLVLVGEIAQAIGEEMKIALTPEAEARLLSRPALSPEVEEIYLRGHYALSLGTPDPVSQAKAQFEKALDLDPDFARAWAGLAATHFVQTLLGNASPREAGPACKQAASKALELDPDLPEALGILGLAHLYFDWDWDASGRELRRALELGPHDSGVRHGYGDYLLVTGRLDESVEQVKLGRLYDPASPLAVIPVVGHLLFAHRYAEVEEEISTILETDPDMPLMRSFLTSALWAQGRYDQALAVMRERWSRSAPDLVEALERGLAQGGPRGAMLAVAEQYVARDSASTVDGLYVARYFALGGDAERALEYMDRAIEARQPSLLHAHVHPDFDSLRDDPRFIDRLERIGLPTSLSF